MILLMNDFYDLQGRQEQRKMQARFHQLVESQLTRTTLLLPLVVVGEEKEVVV